MSGTARDSLYPADGYIITNSHVVEEGDYLKVTLHDGTEYEATVKGKDYDSDVAVLKIEATGFDACCDRQQR